VPAIDPSTRTITRYKDRYNTVNASAGYRYDLTDHQSINISTGIASRAPGINELYSSGLHQGVSGIEEGDVNLETEKAWKTTFEYAYGKDEAYSFNLLAYYQKIDDYIFLRPEQDVRLTIRGAFPVFQYMQTDASISGLDLSFKVHFSDHWNSDFQYSLINTKERESGLTLPFTPTNTFQNTMTYQAGNSVKIGKTQLENLEVSVTNRFTAEQSDISIEQDFLPPPSGYHLLGLRISSDIQVRSLRWRINLTADNLLNTTYRDYLNRLRYFSDDLGRSFTLGLTAKF